MKKHIIIIFVSFIFMAISCNKDIVEPSKLAYIPSNLDTKGGTWKTYLVGKPEEISVAAPQSNTSSEYLTEIDNLKKLVSNITPEQKQAVEYWSAGAVYRWNEIARELAAKYNLAPALGADGKYPVPNAADPLTYPKFPFANPPYTARALAYLSVAQYDALVVAWHYKYQYNRAAPSKKDASLIPLLPVSDLPSYPSEDAVVAAASFTVLKAMFPGEVPYLEAKLAEAKNARLWAGMNVESDVTVGQDLGLTVAGKVMARAKTDGMATANNQTLTPTMIENAKKLGVNEVWLSQESPARPPLLPTYGQVTPWNFGKEEVAKLRPAAPPVIGSAEFQKNMDELVAIAQKQTREQARIASFWSDGAGSYTPPGHWHRTAANLCYENKYSELRTARTMALVGTALLDAGVCCWDVKYYYYYPRPNQMDSRIKTSVGLPNFPSYTSGHSTFSASAATVLSYVFPEKTNEMQNQAKEASESRIYGGIHYRFDCEAGLVCGKNIGNFAVKRGKEDGSGL